MGGRSARESWWADPIQPEDTRKAVRLAPTLVVARAPRHPGLLEQVAMVEAAVAKPFQENQISCAPAVSVELPLTRERKFRMDT